MAETKQYKLVYEKEGELKGSYSGVPTANDADVIERAVLEGKEDPTPVDPTALYHKLVPLDFDEVTPSGTEKVYEMLSVDPVHVWDLYNDRISTAFRFICEDREYIVISYESDETSTAEEARLINLVDIYADDPNAEEHSTFDKISMETDAETGNMRVFLIIK